MKHKFLVLFYFLFCLFQYNSFGQNLEFELDSLLKLADEYYDTDIDKSLAVAKQANILAQSSNNNKLKAESYKILASTQAELGFYVEAIDNANLGLAIPIDDIQFKTKFMEIKAICYSYLGVESRAIKLYYEILEMLEEYNSPEFIHNKAIIYADLSVSYFNQKEEETSIIMANKSIALFQKLDNPNHLIDLPAVYLNKATLFVQRNNDSLYHYTKLSFEEAKKWSLVNYWQQYKFFGVYYFFEQDYTKAEKYFLMSLEEFEKMGFTDMLDKYDIYITLADIYEHRGDVVKQTHYLKKSESLLKDYNFKNAFDVSKAVDSMMETERNTFVEEVKKHQLYIYLAFIALGVLFVFLYQKYRTKLKQSKQEVTQKEKLLKQTEKKSVVLHNKLEDKSFENLIECAKQNKPSFLVLFEEQYPEFIQTVKSMNDKVTTSELSFLAHAFLNFSTKEIAYFTHVTEKAVQTRKYRIRKKYNIPRDVDFNVWVKTLVDKPNSIE